MKLDYLNQLLQQEIPDPATARKDALDVSMDLLIIGVETGYDPLIEAAADSVAALLELMDSCPLVRPDFAKLRASTPTLADALAAAEIVDALPGRHVPFLWDPEIDGRLQ